ncbi:MAG: Fic family protein [Bacteroidota bacterium]
MLHLHDHLESVDFIFDVVKNNRPLTTGFIKELHHLVTLNQKFAEGRDQFGNKLKIELLKGTYKVRENNPTREDGVKILYCPPEHVAAEMDNLVDFYNDLEEKKVHPLIISSWFHHAFSTIHPFQDGNGRVDRLLSSLIFIKHDYFPLTVVREEAKARYISSLELADAGTPGQLVSYFGELQARNIQKALNIREVSETNLLEVQQILVNKIQDWRENTKAKKELKLRKARKQIYNLAFNKIEELATSLRNDLAGTAKIYASGYSFTNNRVNDSGTRFQDYYYKQIVSYARKHDYYFNRFLPKAWVRLKLELSNRKIYQIVISLHHFGYDDNTLAIGSFLEFKSSKEVELEDTTFPIEIAPHVISVINNNVDKKSQNINSYLDSSLTLCLAQIANDMQV